MVNSKKKAEPTFLEREAFQALLNRPHTPQGWRDRVAILLMYDLSLRPSEVVSLCMRDLNMEDGTLVITRHKTHDVHWWLERSFADGSALLWRVADCQRGYPPETLRNLEITLYFY